MLMFIDAKWAEDPAIIAVMCYACFYGGFGQMVAGVFEVRRYQLAAAADVACLHA
jgi:succinate-acetate transporter protein